MIPCRRELFDLPDDVAYLNCAYTAPLLKSAAAAGMRAVNQKSRPWEITARDFFTSLEANRERFGRLVDAPSDHIAIVPAASYGVAVAARNIPVEKDQSIVVLEEQFPSNVNSWRKLAAEREATLVTVSRPGNDDWTAALLATIDSSTAIVAVPHCHWTDGTIIDLRAVGEACRRAGVALVVDGTQSVGALPFSVREIQPDLLVTAAHKWLLGPYGYGFCYVAPRWHLGRPLEENWLNRAGSEDFSKLTHQRDGYQPGARRFDVGEASSFMLAPIAAAALDQLLDWGVAAIAETLRETIGAIAERLEPLGLVAPPKEVRAPHMIGLRAPEGLPDDLSPRLAAEKVYVSVRGDAIRIAPHLHTNGDDLDRLEAALGRCLAR